MATGFKYELGQEVEIIISGEKGYIKARAEYLDDMSSYFVMYKAADGRATTWWLNETEIKPISE